MYFMKALRVEHIKSKRTMLNIIPFALSLIVTICILFICRTSNKDEIVSNSLYYWINISSIAVPLLVGILAGIMGEQEQEAGNYQVIRKSIHRGQNFFFKSLYLLSLLAYFVFFSMILLYHVYSAISSIKLPHAFPYKSKARCCTARFFLL